MQVLPRRTLGVQLVTGCLVALIVVAFVQTSGAPAWAYLLAPVIAAAVVGLTLRKALRRRALARQPFPEDWKDLLDKRVPFYARLDEAGRRRFEFDVQVFLAEQTIYAALPEGGMGPVEERTKVLIAASAAMLVHGRPDLEWPTVRDIVVYPTKFNEDYTVGEGNIAGMVHAQGPVIFSKKDLVHGFRKPHDGHNVALHELAHVLDFGTGSADGLPVGVDFVATAPWIGVVAERLGKVRRKKYRHVLRDYAGTNEAELFAVAVEAFFEKPTKLQARDPELYAMLQDYFQLDPAELFKGPAPKR
ncbi:MAG: M90 family metallopeptidase [Myxococcota bacterium]